MKPTRILGNFKIIVSPRLTTVRRGYYYLITDCNGGFSYQEFLTMKKRLFVAAFIIILSLTLFLCAGSADVLAASSDEEKISPLTVTRETADELARECIKEGKDGLGKPSRIWNDSTTWQEPLPLYGVDGDVRGYGYPLTTDGERTGYIRVTNMSGKVEADLKSDRTAGGFETIDIDKYVTEGISFDGRLYLYGTMGYCLKGYNEKYYAVEQEMKELTYYEVKRMQGVTDIKETVAFEITPVLLTVIIVVSAVTAAVALTVVVIEKKRGVSRRIEKKDKLVTVTSVLMLIGGVATAIIGFMLIRIITADVAEAVLKESGYGALTLGQVGMLAVTMLLSAACLIVSGILGLVNKNKNVLMVIAIASIGYQIISLIVTIGLQQFTPTGMLSLVIPILFLIGVIKSK